MALDLLRRIAESALPMTLTQPEDIDKVRILRTAGLVDAFIPASRNPSIALLLQRPPQVLGITEKGREELLRHGSCEEHHHGHRQPDPGIQRGPRS
jgi:hypothetical protein